MKKLISSIIVILLITTLPLSVFALNSVVCPECGATMRYSHTDLWDIYVREYYLCDNCGYDSYYTSFLGAEQSGGSGISSSGGTTLLPGSILVDNKKFHAGGGSFRGGGAGRNPSEYTVPGDSVINNPYYIDRDRPSVEDIPIPEQVPTVTYDGEISVGLPPYAITVNTNNAGLRKDLSSVDYGNVLTYSGYYYNDDATQLAALLSNHDMTSPEFDYSAHYIVWRGQVPVTGKYYLGYATDDLFYTSGTFQSVFKRTSSILQLPSSDGSRITGGYTVHNSNGSYVSSDYGVAALCTDGINLSEGQILTVYVHSTTTTDYPLTFVEMRSLGYSIPFVCVPSQLNVGPEAIENIHAFDVTFDPDLDINVFVPIDINVNVDAGDTLYEYTYTENNNTYTAYYYNQVIDNVTNTTVYYVIDNYIAGSVTYNQTTNEYTIYNYGDVTEIYYDTDSDPSASPSPSETPGSTPAPSGSPVATPEPDSGASGGNDDNTDGGFFDALGDLLGGIVNGILGVLVRLFGSIVDFVVWFIQQVGTFIPWLPGPAVTALGAGVVICVILRILKFILGR